VKCDAVIVAGGSSARFGENKLAADLCGRPLLAWALAAFEAAPSVDTIVLVAGAGCEAWAENLAKVWAPTKFRAVVPGGARRESVEAGLRACRSRYVAIHDGARPLIAVTTIELAIAGAAGKPGAIVAIPITDTVKEVANGAIVGHPDRSRLFAAQTPQVVLRQAWLDAAAASDNDETDDAAMLARLGLECVVVEGSVENIKITRPMDLEMARMILERRMAE